MKVLIITHSGNLTYGAAKSLKLLLENLNAKYDVVFNKPILKSYSLEEIKEYTGPNCENIFFYNLPLKYSVMSAASSFANYSNPLHRFIAFVKRTGRYFLYLFTSGNIKKKINEPQYDFIYLNSSILYPLISKEKKTVIHIRELIKTNVSKRVQKQFEKAYKTICIDKATCVHYSEAIKNHNNQTAFVITNPFDMRPVFNVNRIEAMKKYGISEETIVFLIAGIITEEKGVQFVAESFSSIEATNKLLLVVGKKNSLSEYLESKQLNNVVFLEEKETLFDIYSFSDCLIRGEKEFCTGRTVFEALYSGLQVFLPGKPQDIHGQEFEDDQIERVFFYEPRNKDSFLKNISKISKTNRSIISKNNNIERFANRINSIFGKGE